jgi:DNA-binding HxlR family transcriptional regulator
MTPELANAVWSSTSGNGLRPVLPTTPGCPLETTLIVLGGHWRPLVLWGLFWGAKPFCDLMRATPGITKKSLRHELVELERYGLVRKDVRPKGIGRAEYALTTFGETLKPLVAAMYEWGLYASRDGRHIPSTAAQVPA